MRNHEFQDTNDSSLSLCDVHLARGDHRGIVLKHRGRLLSNTFDVLQISGANAARYSGDIGQLRRADGDKGVSFGWIVHVIPMRPNIQGNRRAAPMVTEGQSMWRRVRLTVRLGGTVLHIFGCKPSVLGDVREHLWADFVTIMEGKHEVRVGSRHA